MNILHAVVIGISLIIGLPALATTLRLPDEIELVVVDGKPLGGTLLRGADSLELEKGHHQLVFAVGKARDKSQPLPPANPLPLMVALFHTHNARQLSFRLPALNTPAEREAFSRRPAIALVDQNGAAIDATFTQLSPDESAVMAALGGYNPGQAGIADQTATAAAPPGKAGVGQIEQMLRFWFLQADNATRDHFIQWAQQHRQQPPESKP